MVCFQGCRRPSSFHYGVLCLSPEGTSVQCKSNGDETAVALGQIKPKLVVLEFSTATCARQEGRQSQGHSEGPGKAVKMRSCIRLWPGHYTILPTASESALGHAPSAGHAPSTAPGHAPSAGLEEKARAPLSLELNRQFCSPSSIFTWRFERKTMVMRFWFFIHIFSNWITSKKTSVIKLKF